jgi:6-phosphogluconate dehydrogenase
MKIGMIGLGRMGMNMAKRLLQDGREVVAYNRTPDKTDQLVKEGASGAYSMAELVRKLDPPRCTWLMLPAGNVVEDHILQLRDLLSPEDIVVDGGNTFYKEDIRRATLLAENRIRFLDAGVSGGIWGLKEGYCLMIGGDRQCFDLLEPVFRALSPEEGYLYCGKTGAGHFVKMVHNGIEYGMMQAYGEGFEILEASEYASSFDYAEIAHMWNTGSVIRSWLLELAEAAFKKNSRLSDIHGYVQDSGEGRWTIQQALDTGVPAEVITLSLLRRFRSRQKDPFTERVLAALRREFGGHTVVPTVEKEQ